MKGLVSVEQPFPILHYSVFYLSLPLAPHCQKAHSSPHLSMSSVALAVAAGEGEVYEVEAERKHHSHNH